MKWGMEELLPHRPPMVLIDEIESFEPEARTLWARFTVTKAQVFFLAGENGEGGVPNWAAIEYMAQTAAALAGCHDRMLAPDRPARPGLLLGTRRLELGLERFEEGRVYRVRAVNAFSDSDAASFECAIFDEAGKEVASAILNAYRPPNLKDFLMEQAKA